MKTHMHRTSIAVLVSAAAALVGTTAAADTSLGNGSHSSMFDDTAQEGNSDIGNWHMLLNRTFSTWTPTDAAHVYDQKSSALAETDFIDYGLLFGDQHEIISALATGRGAMSESPYNYTQEATASFSIMGSQVASPTFSTCESKTICANIDQSISKTFYSNSYPFTVGPVPVWVSASAYGRAYANVAGKGYGQKFIGRAGYFMGNPASSLSAGASITASLTAAAGVPDVLAVGVTGNFGIIAVDVTPHANELLISYPPRNGSPASATASWNLGTPVNFTTMNGSVDVWAQVTPFWTPSSTIVSWGGASWNYDIYSDVNQVTY